MTPREACKRIAEHGREQPVPMDPVAFNMMRWAEDALEAEEGRDDG